MIANMILGMILLNKRYTATKYLSVIMISVGIATCTIMSAQHVKGKDDDDADKNASADDAGDKDEKDSETVELLRWCTGISMLTFALFMSARMGIYQEVIYKKHGKHPREALFYSVSFLILLNMFFFGFSLAFSFF